MTSSPQSYLVAFLILLICGTFLRLTKILLFNLGHGNSKQFFQESSLLLVRLMTQHIRERELLLSSTA